MDLKDLYRLVVFNLGLVLSCVALLSGVTALVTILQTPQYESKIQLFVSTPASALDITSLVQGSSFTQQRVISYAQIIDGEDTLRPVIQTLSLPYSPQDLAKKITASAPLQTVLINVTVRDDNPYQASNIANAVGQQFAITVQQLEAQINQSTIAVSVVKPAVPILSPVSPKKTINFLFAIIVGFGIGILLSIVRAFFDNTVKNEEQLDSTVLLAAVNFDEEAAVKPLTTDLGRYSARTESFRSLRTNLQSLGTSKNQKIFSITSCMPQEGKTTSSINLAISCAQAGKKTLLIEADLRRPTVGKYIQIGREKYVGFSEIMRSNSSSQVSLLSKKAIFQWGDFKLNIMMAGSIPANPAELLNSTRLNELLVILRRQYDIVIIDTPPVLPVTDAAIIASKVDGVILVARGGKTRASQFKGACETLRLVNAQIIGTVINMIPINTREYDNYGYRYGYGRRYGRRYGGKYGGKYGGIYGGKYGYAYSTNEYSSKGSADDPYAPNNEARERIEHEDRLERMKGKIDAQSKSTHSKKGRGLPKIRRGVDG
jgi:capsular exopolysaccharide synthesis family protein